MSNEKKPLNQRRAENAIANAVQQLNRIHKAELPIPKTAADFAVLKGKAADHAQTLARQVEYSVQDGIVVRGRHFKAAQETASELMRWLGMLDAFETRENMIEYAGRLLPEDWDLDIVGDPEEGVVLALAESEENTLVLQKYREPKEAGGRIWYSWTPCMPEVAVPLELTPPFGSKERAIEVARLMDSFIVSDTANVTGEPKDA